VSDWRDKLRKKRGELRGDDAEPTRLATDEEREQLADQAPADWSAETPSDVLLAAGLIRLLIERRLIERKEAE
jgi:hypothetical protein